MPYTVFVPYVGKDTEQEEESLFNLIKNSPHQQRERMVRNFLLDSAAQLRANDMAENNYFSHISPSGVSPNEVVRSVGYELPDWYPFHGNNVESIYIGGDVSAAAQAWYDSAVGHRPHVYGQHEFFREQEYIGVATKPAKDGRTISVFISAPHQSQS